MYHFFLQSISVICSKFNPFFCIATNSLTTLLCCPYNDDEDGERDEGANHEQADPDGVYNRILWLAILRLEAFARVHFLVQADATKLDDDEANVHGKLEENEADAFGYELIGR